MDAIFDIFTFIIYVYGGMLGHEWTSEANFLSTMWVPGIQLRSSVWQQVPLPSEPA